MLSMRPLGSTGVTPLPRYYAPHRLPADAALRLCIPAKRRLRCRFRTARSPRFLDESLPARCPQAPRKARRMHAPVSSPPVSGFTTLGRLAVLQLRHEAESGLTALRLAGSLCEASTRRIAPALARAATCRTGNSHGGFLSFH